MEINFMQIQKSFKSLKIKELGGELYERGELWDFRREGGL